MGGCYDLRERLQARIGWRLGLENIERGAGNVPGFDGIGQRGLVDEVAPGCVDDADAFPGACEPVRIHEVPCLLIGRHVKRQIVGAREQIVQ